MRYIQMTIGLLFVGMVVACGSGNQGGSLGEANRYIVVLKKTQPVDSSQGQGLEAQELSGSAVGGLLLALESEHQIEKPTRTFSKVLQGGVYQLDPLQVEILEADPRVAYVERDQVVHINSTQSSATWGLDRIDQVSLPLDQSYSYPDTTVQVNAYIIDTGILATHQEFQGRAVGAVDFVDSAGGAVDCNGHGTHVAGTLGGANFGVAKNAKLYGVRVLDCNGSGSISDVVAGIEWVTANHVKPAVVNMSLGGGGSQAIDDAIKASVQAGITMVVAAGNEGASACGGSPSRVPEAITVASTTSSDARSSFSNYGTCVDVFAPGSDITSAWIGANSASQTISGTSMASPHVAGIAALYLSLHPQALPSEVTNAILAGALSSKVSTPGAGSPNLLVNTSFLFNAGGGGGGGGGGQPAPDTRLQASQPLNDQSGKKSEEKFYAITVPAGTKKLHVKISGGVGDADLYVRANSHPTASIYDCRPYISGNNEVCTIDAPVTGDYSIMIRGYIDYSGVSILATLEAAVDDAPCTACKVDRGSLASKGQYVYLPNSSGFKAAAGLYQFWLKGPSAADFDIYLYKRQGSRWELVAQSTSSTSVEKISYQASAGTYRMKIVSYSGSGAFEFWSKIP